QRASSYAKPSVDPSAAAGYPPRMALPASSDLAAELVSGALDAPDAPQAYGALLDTLSRAWRAERALLVSAADGGRAVLVHEVGTHGTSPDPALLAAAFAADAPMEIG